jgi:beta-lactamase class A
MAQIGKKNLRIILIGILLICGSCLICRCYGYFQEAKIRQDVFKRKKAAWQELKQELTKKIVNFKGEAGIVVKDLQFDWEISFNKDKLFPSASLVKMPIMAACFLAAQEGKIRLDRQVVLKNSDKLSGSGILKDVRPGATFTVAELIGLMIYDSDNTAANILTGMVGIDYLNRVFGSLGLKHTNLSRRIADFNLRDRGIENYTTAQDIAWLLEQIYSRTLIHSTAVKSCPLGPGMNMPSSVSILSKPRAKARGVEGLINRQISESCLQVLKLQRVNDRIPRYLPLDTTVAHKTGLERGVCHDAGIILSRKGDFIICVLTKHENIDAIASKNFIAQVAMTIDTYSKLP